MDWASRFAIGPVTDDDRVAFEEWRECSPAHREAYRVATAFLDELRTLDLPLQMPRPILANDNAADLRAGQPRVSRRAFLGSGAMAASVAAGVIAAQSPLGLWPTLSEFLADERTGPGERRTLSPMAGIDIEMNARSSLSFRDDEARLIAGEIFVNVEKLGTPYQVTTNGPIVTASAARFNVNALDSELCVTCLEGEIKATRDERDFTLRDGQAVIWRNNGKVLRKEADETAVLAWRRGLLVFNGTPLESAVSEINRHFPGRLVLRGGGLEARPVTGVFHVDQIELAVVQIQQLTGVSATRLPGGVVLLG
ncbi:FecR family protein [Sphingopyxis sp. R3-92]|uniref:FecR family protein n=1 Tax=Sphingopyxis sp. R3-92 TaxID=3158553 RepID=UPI003EE7EFA6